MYSQKEYIFEQIEMNVFYVFFKSRVCSQVYYIQVNIGRDYFSEHLEINTFYTGLRIISGASFYIFPWDVKLTLKI